MRARLEEEQRRRRQLELEQIERMQREREQRELLQLEQDLREQRHAEQERRKRAPGTVQADVDRLQELQRMFQEWSDRARSYARDTHDPYSWYAFLNVAHALEAQQDALQVILQACGTEARPLQEKPLHEAVAESMSQRRGR